MTLHPAPNGDDHRPMWRRAGLRPRPSGLDEERHRRGSRRIGRDASGFISYGGRTGGIEAVEQLRTVFVNLNTKTIRNLLTFPGFCEHFSDHRASTNPAAIAGATSKFNEQLA